MSDMVDAPSNSSSARRAAPNYGVDAPAVMITLLSVGVAGMAAGFFGLAFFSSLAVRSVAAVISLIALAPLFLGLAMAAYAALGKRRLRDWMLNRLDWRGDETVLDIGAGRGLMAVGAARRVPRGRVIAVDVWRQGDLSGNGPDALAANAEAEGVRDRIEIVTADARKLDLPDRSVDVVLSVLCLHNIDPIADRMIACREIARVLKPGGRALIGDYMGAASYAAAFGDLGMAAEGPLNKLSTALGLMWVVDARNP